MKWRRTSRALHASFFHGPNGAQHDGAAAPLLRHTQRQLARRQPNALYTGYAFE
jgi:hypothetical protein